MKVLLPRVNRDARQVEWKSTDVIFSWLLILQKNLTISQQYKDGNMENLMFFFNKPPKWNECKLNMNNCNRGASICVEFQWKS